MAIPLTAAIFRIIRISGITTTTFLKPVFAAVVTDKFPPAILVSECFVCQSARTVPIMPCTTTITEISILITTAAIVALGQIIHVPRALAKFVRLELSDLAAMDAVFRWFPEILMEFAQTISFANGAYVFSPRNRFCYVFGQNERANRIV